MPQADAVLEKPKHKKIWVLVTSLFVLLTTLGFHTNAAAAVPEKIRIGVVASTGYAPYKNAGSVKFTAQGNYQVLDLAVAIPGLNVLGDVKEGSIWQVSYLTAGIQVLCDGQPITITTGPVAIKEVSHSGSNLVKLVSYIPNGSTKETAINKRYRGNMEFKVGQGYLLGINELPMDEYLYGVVPREMSNSWPIEALKAQALAARTYAAANYNKRNSLGFNLLDTPDDQAYGGYNSEGPQATLAVQQTAGEIITYESKPISAVYHSNSGGHTEDNNNVWNAPAIPYLRGKEDTYSLQCRFGNWTYATVSYGVDSNGRQGIQDKLRSLDPKFGTLAGFELEKYPSGRVKNVVITDTSGYTIQRTGRQFGQLFNPGFYTYLNEESFMSPLFDIETDNSINVLDAGGQVREIKGGPGLMVATADGVIEHLQNSTNQFLGINDSGTSEVSIYPQNITINGHGWGHGVGMSQWGAHQMATEGKTYREIIEFYYTGVQITKS